MDVQNSPSLDMMPEEITRLLECVFRRACQKKGPTLCCSQSYLFMICYYTKMKATKIFFTLERLKIFCDVRISHKNVVLREPAAPAQMFRYSQESWQ